MLEFVLANIGWYWPGPGASVSYAFKDVPNLSASEYP